MNHTQREIVAQMLRYCPHHVSEKFQWAHIEFRQGRPVVVKFDENGEEDDCFNLEAMIEYYEELSSDDSTFDITTEENESGSTSMEEENGEDESDPIAQDEEGTRANPIDVDEEGTKFNPMEIE